MSGHSKWETIKRKKAVTDAKRGKEFTKLSKSITVAVKKGNSGDPELNPSLRLAIEKAKQANVPKDKIQSAINRALGSDSASLIEITYEAYVYGGIALVIRCATDNKNRLAGEIRTVLGNHDSSIGAPNSALYIFDNTDKPSFKTPLKESDKEGFSDLLDELDELDDVLEVINNAE